MANSFVRYTGDGNTSAYSIPFSYRSTADLVVTLAGVATTAYTLNAAGTTLTFNSPPASSTAIEIRRKTSQGTKLVDYASGSVLTESDLDTDSDQAFFMGQEAIDDANDRIKVDATNFQWDAQNKRLTNVADPTSAQDAATKNYLENTWLSSSDKANINTLAGISGLATLAANNTNINTVAANNTNVTNVGSDIANVNTVATNITSVNTVATNITKVVAVADDLAEAVSEVVTVADDLNEATSEIDTVATNITNVNTVGNAIANVNLVGNSITNVNLVANNVSGVNAFAERYRISSSAPSTSNDVGDLYFDTTANELKVYKSSGWAAAGSTVNGTASRYQYTATNGQTTFSGADSSGATLAYDSPFVDIYLNGVKLANADYTATSGTSIVLASGASTGDILSVVAYGTFQLANISIKDLTDTPSGFGTAGQALVMNSSANALVYANASSPEVYGFEKNASGQLIVTTTNEGADNISESTYASFEDVMFGASGMTWSISNGKLIATI